MVNPLGGRIPTELGQLTNLEYLALSWNELSGPIPAELGRLTKLAELWLDANQLSGTIPSELGQLANLKELRLAGNPGLTGCVPTPLSDVAEHDLAELGLPACESP